MSYAPEQNNEIIQGALSLTLRALLIFGVALSLGLNSLAPALNWSAPEPWQISGLAAHLIAVTASRGGVPTLVRYRYVQQGQSYVRQNVYHSRESTVMMLTGMTAALAVVLGICLYHGLTGLASASLQLLTLLLARFLRPLNESVRRRAMILTFVLAAISLLLKDFAQLQGAS